MENDKSVVQEARDVAETSTKVVQDTLNELIELVTARHDNHRQMAWDLEDAAANAAREAEQSRVASSTKIIMNRDAQRTHGSAQEKMRRVREALYVATYLL